MEFNLSFENLDSVEVLQYFTSNSDTMVAVKEKNGKYFQLIRSGKIFLLPVIEGDEFAIHIINCSEEWRAYPTFVQGLNIYKNGPTTPEKCSSRQMWETESHLIVEGLFDPETQNVQPFVVTPTGVGENTREATLAGLIQIYERDQVAICDDSVIKLSSVDTRGLPSIGYGEAKEKGSYTTGKNYCSESPELVMIQLVFYKEVYSILEPKLGANWSRFI